METYMELYRCLPLRASIPTDRREFSPSGSRRKQEELPSSDGLPPFTLRRKALYVSSIEVLSEQ
jgi:hypothetical protein